MIPEPREPVADPQHPWPRRILVLYAHPSPDRSEVNRHLASAAAQTPGVSLVDLYAAYPDYGIDIEREQERLLEHDVIVFLHPLYWYSTPAILKEWQDLVLEHGFAYGTEGTRLHGKIFFSALSAGGPEQAYRDEGFHHFSIRELLNPLEQTAHLCGMVYLPPFALFSARTALDDGRLQSHVSEWVLLLEALRDDRLSISQAQKLPKLSGALPQLLQQD